MNLRQILIVVFLFSCSWAKYEDQFGKVYDWKREGLGQTVDAVFSRDSIFLLSRQGFAVLNYQGKTRLAVDVDYSSYAVNHKAERIFFLSADRLQVYEFSTATGGFVQTLATDRGYSAITQTDREH